MSKSKRKRQGLRLGMRVVTTGTLEGADPFVPLVVVEVHTDHTVDVAEQGGGRVWKRVKPHELTVIQS